MCWLVIALLNYSLNVQCIWADMPPEKFVRNPTKIFLDKTHLVLSAEFSNQLMIDEAAKIISLTTK